MAEEKYGEVISIIIPVYNAEKYLTRCLDSVINQTYKKLEIIVVDDGSTDDSKKILEEYEKKDSRMVIIHKNNGGMDIISVSPLFFLLTANLEGWCWWHCNAHW